MCVRLKNSAGKDALSRRVAVDLKVKHTSCLRCLDYYRLNTFTRKDALNGRVAEGYA